MTWHLDANGWPVSPTGPSTTHPLGGPVGPADGACGTCANLARLSFPSGRVILKCRERIAQNGTHHSDLTGLRTVRKKWPACVLFSRTTTSTTTTKGRRHGQEESPQPGEGQAHPAHQA